MNETKLSKQDLFQNSRIFQENIKNNQVSNCTSFLFDENYKFSETTLDSEIETIDDSTMDHQGIIQKMMTLAK